MHGRELLSEPFRTRRLLGRHAVGGEPDTHRNAAGGAPTATATLGVVGTATASPTPGPCVGDCNSNGVVTINELIIGVNIALGNASIGQCPSFDLNNDDMIAVSELVAGVNALLNGCV